jgi:cell wall-associated NlpC family hydrolase
VLPSRGSVVSVVSAAALVGLLGAPATAEPTHPSESEIDEAREAEGAAAQAVTAVEERIAASAGRLDNLQIAAARAVEAHNGARIAMAEAEVLEEAAAARAANTAAEAELARDQLGRLAAAAYRHGSQLVTIGFVLEAENDEEFFDGAVVLRSVTRTQGSIYERWLEKSAAAKAAAAEAVRALRSRQAAARTAQEAFDEAARAVAEQEAALASAESDHAALVAELAAARGTTVELERRRQAGLEMERATQREREALAAAAADATPRSDADVGPASADEPAPVSPAGQPPPAQEPAPLQETEPVAPTQVPRPPAAEPPAPAPPPPSSASAVQKVIDYARAQLGKPYQWGAAGPDAFDCSGLTMRAWQQGGKSLSHWSVAQARAVTRVSYANIRPGDLIFWSDNEQASGTYHVGLYIGGAKMIHAPRPGKVVEIQSVFYWRTPSFYGRV